MTKLHSDVFYMLDRLKPTAMGLAVPAWFLQLVAPAFAAPLTNLLNQSISTFRRHLIVYAIDGQDGTVGHA